MTREEVRKVVWEGMNPQVRGPMISTRRYMNIDTNPLLNGQLDISKNAPAWVWFVGEDGTPGELPKTASGKVQKHILRDWSKTLAKDGIGLTQT